MQPNEDLDNCLPGMETQKEPADYRENLLAHDGWQMLKKSRDSMTSVFCGMIRSLQELASAALQTPSNASHT